MSMSASVVSIGDIELQSGVVFPDLKISHSTFGTLNAARSNAILLPTFYGGKHSELLYLRCLNETDIKF